MYLGQQGLQDQKLALESARTVLSKGIKHQANDISASILPSENTIMEDSKRKSMGKTLFLRNSTTFANEIDVESEDIEMITKKIRVSDCGIREKKDELKKKSKEIEECKADINDYIMRLDLLNAQIKDLKMHLDLKINALNMQFELR